MRYPLVAPLVALIAGIIAAQHATFTFQETLLSILSLAGLALLSIRLRARSAAPAALLAAFVCAGAMLASLDDKPDPRRISAVVEREGADLNDPIRIRGYVTVPPEPLGYADRFVLQTESIFRQTPARGGVRVSVYRQEEDRRLELPYGSRVEFLGRLRRLRNFGNPGSFDRVRYLRRQGLDMIASVRRGTPIFLLDGERGSVWLKWIWWLRENAGRRFEALVGRPASPGGELAPAESVLRAILLGDRVSLDRETTTQFQRTGAYHALVISGLHVGIVASVFFFIFRLVNLPRLLQASLSLASVFLYALLAGAQLPALRASFMFATLLVAALFYRKRSAFNAISATAFGFLVFDLELLYDVGFQMSFLAVGLIAGVALPVLERTVDPYRLGLIDIWNEDRDLHLAPPVAQHRVALRMYLKPLRALTKLPKWTLSVLVCGPLRVLVWLAALTVVSAVVQLGLTLPMAAHFQRVTLGGISANLLVMPLLFIAVPFGLAALATNSQTLASTAVWAAGQITAVVEWHAENLPLEFRVPPPPNWLAVLFAVALVLLAVSFGRGRVFPALASTLSLAALVLVVLHPFPHRYKAGVFELTALDVGQGEALFLGLPDGKTMLVDGGGLPDYGGTVQRTLDIGEQVVSPYLWSRSIKIIDVIAVTHPDVDHIGGVPALLKNFRVGEVWLDGASIDSDYEPLKQLALDRGVPIVALRRHSTRSLGEVRFEVLGPPRHMDGFHQNDRSLVLRAHYGRHSFLLTGDIGRRGEAALMRTAPRTSREHVLKIAHHGSKTSTHDPFLEYAQPVIGVISAGYRNSYGHPHHDVLERLASHDVFVLRTDLEGAVTVSTDGHRLHVDTFRRRNLGRKNDEQPGRNRFPPAAAAGMAHR